MIFKHLLALLFMLAISAPLLGQDLADLAAGDVIDYNTSIPEGALIYLNGGTIASRTNFSAADFPSGLTPVSYTHLTLPTIYPV